MDKRALVRIATSPYVTDMTTSAYFYGTNDTVAEMVTAGYWNDARDQLNSGDVILASGDIDGTGDIVFIRIDTVPVSGDITSSTETGAAGA